MNVEIKYLSYLFFTVFGALACYLISQWYSDPQLKVPYISGQIIDNRVLGTVVSLLIVISSFMDSNTSVSLGDPFFFLLILIVALITISGLLSQSWSLQILHVSLLIILYRGLIWFRFPFIGKDTIGHINLVEYIVTFGKIFPEFYSYYHDYLIMLLFSAIVTEVAGLSAKTGFFYTFIPLLIGGLLLMIKFSERGIFLDTSDFSTLIPLCMIYISFSGWFILRSTFFIPQTANFYFIPVSLWLFSIRDDRRARLLLFIFVLIGVGVHNTTMFIVSSLLVLYLATEKMVAASNHVANMVGMDKILRYYKPEKNSASIVVAITAISVSYYWIWTGYIDYQVGRITDIFLSFLYPTGLGSAVQNSSSGQLISTNVIISIDPFLMYAGSLLAAGFLMTFTIISFVDETLRGIQTTWNLSWLFPIAIVFSLIGAGTISGLQGHIGRIFGESILISSPFFIAFFKKMNNGLIGRILIVIFLVTSVFFGVGNPVAAITERDIDKPILKEGEASAMYYAQEYNINSSSDAYLAGRLHHELKGEGLYDSHPVISAHKDHRKITVMDVHKFLRGHDKPFIFRSDIYKNNIAAGRYNSVYDSGSTKIIYNSI